MPRRILRGSLKPPAVAGGFSYFMRLPHGGQPGHFPRWYREYAGRGLQLLGLPCNQFGGQTPGTDEEIRRFCRLHYDTTFPQTAKIKVNGPEALTLYTFLKAQKGFAGFGEGKMADLLRAMLSEADPDYARKSDIKWNFTKFLVDRTGRVAARFEPTADLKEVEAFFRTLL